MRVVVDIERCRGAGQCPLTAPHVFDQDDEDGTVVVLDDEPPPPLYGAVRMAAQLCPNSVIRVANDA
jgi:ferredoxin